MVCGASQAVRAVRTASARSGPWARDYDTGCAAVPRYEAMRLCCYAAMLLCCAARCASHGPAWTMGAKGTR
eukprot:10116672-Alexandrium_andersonii.AAC.1